MRRRGQSTAQLMVCKLPQHATLRLYSRIPLLPLFHIAVLLLLKTWRPFNRPWLFRMWWMRMGLLLLFSKAIRRRIKAIKPAPRVRYQILLNGSSLFELKRFFFLLYNNFHWLFPSQYIGSPLVGDRKLQQAISRSLLYSCCFLQWSTSKAIHHKLHAFWNISLLFCSKVHGQIMYLIQLSMEISSKNSDIKQFSRILLRRPETGTFQIHLQLVSVCSCSKH